jgi:hypothetical protein
MRALKILGLVAAAISVLVVVEVPVESALTRKRHAAELQELKVFFGAKPSEAVVVEFLKNRKYQGVDVDPMDDDVRALLVEDYEMSAETAARGVKWLRCFKPMGGEGFFFSIDVNVTALFDSSGNLVQEIVDSSTLAP